jgi:hypothetical protein
MTSGILALSFVVVGFSSLDASLCFDPLMVKSVLLPAGSVQ